MNPVFWAMAAIGAVGTYTGAVLLIGFDDRLAIAINFGRVALAVAVLILYVPALGVIFRSIPPPRRDYLLAGIILTWTSAICFAVGNEVGRIFDIEMSIFTNPIAGFFSLLLVTGGLFHLLAPDMGGLRKTLIAISIGVAFGIAIVFIAPMFR